MKKNLILTTDSNKFSHAKAYAPGATRLFSYLESRGGAFPETVFFGLQYYLKEYLSQPVTMQDVEEAREFMAQHGPDFDYEGWKHIVTRHGGYLPVRIRAVPEGTVVPTGNVLLTIESTDERVFWLPNFLETLLLKVWYPITVASQNLAVRKTILESLIKTSDDPDSEIEFKLHSFGYRGSTSEESSAIGSAAELLVSRGTDTISGIRLLQQYYHGGMEGFSINASEHSTITSFGRDGELNACRNMLKQFGRKGGIFACVSDSYDIFNCVERIWGTELRQDIIDSGATLVIRPDSGDATEVVPKCLNIMADRFGYTTNSKGYKVINNVRLIQGDGVNPESIKNILSLVNTLGYSTTNIAFGMGGASLQGTRHNVINRDTCKFAFKASNITVDGHDRDVYKDPITDQGKRSKAGRLDLICTDKGFETVRIGGQEIYHPNSALQTVFRNGELLVDAKFDKIRNRVK